MDQKDMYGVRSVMLFVCCCSSSISGYDCIYIYAPGPITTICANAWLSHVMPISTQRQHNTIIIK